MAAARPVRSLPGQLLRVLRQFPPANATEARSFAAFGQNFDPHGFSSLSIIDEDEVDDTTIGLRTWLRHPSGRVLELVSTTVVTNTIRVDLNASRVTKTCNYYPALADREAAWLQKLAGLAIPRLVTVHGATIATTYEPVNIYNLPADWRQQAEQILAHLQAAGCCHNDLKAGNIVVADGRLKVIDFAWATQTGEPIPEDWPIDLGFEHFIAPHEFDDRKAIFEALEAVEDAASAAVTPPAPAAPPQQ